MKQTLFAVLFSFASIASLAAQCVVQSASLATYGNGCAPVFTQPTIAGSFDPTPPILNRSNRPYLKTI